MNVLFLALYPPYPPVDGGRLRTFNILKQVASRHSVTLVCFEDSISSKNHSQILNELCRQVVVVPLPPRPARNWMTKIRDLSRTAPIGLRGWESRKMRADLHKLVSEKQFGLAHIDHPLLAQYADIIRHLPRVLTYHNVETVARHRELQFSHYRSPLRTWAGMRESARWERFEIAAAKSVEAIVTVSEIDSRYFSERVARTPIHVVPNGVDTDHFRPLSRCGDKLGLLFTGRMDYAPNIDAVRWFCSEIFPLVRKNCPEVTLMIVGRDPTPEVIALGNYPGVVVTGTVKDVRPYYSSSSVYIVPLRFGGGTRLKILEAMSMEMPIVSTELGCEGLDLLPGQDLLAANTPGFFANTIMHLLEDKAARTQLGQHARQTAMTRFDWDVVGDAQEQAYQQALNRRVH